MQFMSEKKANFSQYKIFWNKLDYLKIDQISLKHDWFANPGIYFIK